MTAEQITTILSNLGVIIFLGMWIRALKKQIEVQKNTLEALKMQVSETEKIGNIYRKLFEELPSEVEKWKVAILKLKDERINELEKANQDKDERLQKTAQIEINKLELQRQALEDIPKLLEQFKDTAKTLEQRLSIVDQLAGTTLLEFHLADVRKAWSTTLMSSLWSHDLSKRPFHYLILAGKKDGKDTKSDKMESNSD
jgi:hypothetical protein